MKFLCLAYLDRGLAPPPGVTADYGALGEAMRAAGVFIDSGQRKWSRCGNTVLIPLVGSAFDHNGDPQNPAAATAAGILLDDLAWWAAVLQQARRDNPLPPAALRKMAAAGNAGH